jgi:hypothetical protein
MAVAKFVQERDREFHRHTAGSIFSRSEKIEGIEEWGESREGSKDAVDS